VARRARRVARSGLVRRVDDALEERTRFVEPADLRERVGVRDARQAGAAAVRGLEGGQELADAALLAAHQQQLRAEQRSGFRNLRGATGGQRRDGEPFARVEASVEEREQRGERLAHEHEARNRSPLEPGFEGVHHTVEARAISELEKVGDLRRLAPQRTRDVAAPVGERHEFPGQRETLLGVRRLPERPVPRHQCGREGIRVAAAPRHREGIRGDPIAFRVCARARGEKSRAERAVARR
jgi:hypothetical protein